jgi:hypothetical protein
VLLLLCPAYFVCEGNILERNEIQKLLSKPLARCRKVTISDISSDKNACFSNPDFILLRDQII